MLFLLLPELFMRAIAIMKASDNLLVMCAIPVGSGIASDGSRYFNFNVKKHDFLAALNCLKELFFFCVFMHCNIFRCVSFNAGFLCLKRTLVKCRWSY